jgi:hypothetical protein
MYRSTLEAEPGDIWNPREREDTPEWVKGEVPEKAECHLRYFGSEDREF